MYKRQQETQEPKGEEKPFYLEDGTTLNNLSELLGALKFMDDTLFSKYVTPEKNDFANWVEFCLGNKELANRMRVAKSKDELVEILEGYIA